MRYPAYPSYRATGISFLSHLPTHWAAKRLRFVTDGIEQGWSPQCDNNTADDDAWGVMKVGCVNGHLFDATENKALPVDLTPMPEYELHPGDVLISRANTKELVGSAAVVPNDVRPKLLLCDKLFRVKPSHEIHAGFLTYFLRTPAARYQYEKDATGASGSMQNIGQDTIKDLMIVFPEYTDQTRIAKFLEWKTGQIDALIAKKQELIETLTEQRQAAVILAATQGLDPSTPMRPSSIPWARKIPAHWTCGNIRRFATMKTGHTPSRTEPDYWVDCDIPWFTLADVWQLRDDRRTYLGQTKEMISHKGLMNSAAELLPAGTVVFSRTASVGYSGIMPTPMATSQDFWNWVPDPVLTSQYLLILFRAMKQEFQRMTMGSTHKTIYQGDAAGLRICVPPIEEQLAIVQHVQRVTEDFDGMLDKASEAIACLTEYRSALITAAVTGQIDVRHVAVPEAA